MKGFYLACWAGACVVACLSAPAQETTMTPVLQIDGVPWVRADLLSARAKIAVKELPGQTEVVACFRDRCALLKPLRREDQILISVSDLSSVLGLDLAWNDPRDAVSFQPGDDPSSKSEQPLGVGRLAPNIRLPKLDGGWITLDELRGKRVLINSWASW